ncbi:MAG: DUF1566 domain-containing protein, partial [Fusobacterium sp.]|nr:DUF1566 domain-containing protein [Fusobacterium sp.]
PSLTGNINERTWNTQRKALYSRLSQAISLMPALNGFGSVSEATSSASAVDTAAETFITGGLAKVLKINNICDYEHLADCGVVSGYTNMGGSSKTTATTLYQFNNTFSLVAYSGSSYSTMDTKAAAFETQNGESIVAYYNPSCKTEYLNQESLTISGNVFGFSQATMCVNFVYDLNGTKGPNTVGKDIGFITVFNATDSIVVAPMPSTTSNATDTKSWVEAARACRENDSESRLPNVDELSAIALNKDLTNFSSGAFVWSSSLFDSTHAWHVSTSGVRSSHLKTAGYPYRCVKR